jgi:hypothetical protein
MNGELRSSTSGGNWPGIVAVLLLGYMCMGRSFAYWGIPAWHVFVGEIVLLWFLVFGPRVTGGNWPWVATSVPELRTLWRVMTLLLIYGVFEIAHGMFNGYPLLTAFRDFAFDYYMLYFFLGIWVGLRRPAELPKFFRLFAWINGIYGLAYILFLSHLSWLIPGVSQQSGSTPVFGLPECSSIALLGLLVFEKDLRKVWHLLLLNGLVLLGMQVRAEWVGFLVGVLIFTLATKKVRKVAAAVGAVALLLVLGYAANFKVPGPLQRGGDVSTRGIIGRAVAPFDPDLAADYTFKSMQDESTAIWRLLWWAAIWQEVNGTPEKALFGLGYGYPLGNLSPQITEGDFIPTPHNDLLYALAYTGWIGLALFLVLQATLFRLLWKVFTVTGQAFGLVFWGAMLATACFGACLEAPYGAIPFYLILGWAVAPLLLRARAEKRRAPKRMHPVQGKPRLTVTDELSSAGA